LSDRDGEQAASIDLTKFFAGLRTPRRAPATANIRRAPSTGSPAPY